jgi:hypothetical protein
MVSRSVLHYTEACRGSCEMEEVNANRLHEKVHRVSDSCVCGGANKGSRAISDPLPPNSAKRTKKQRVIRSMMSRTTLNLFRSMEFTVTAYISREGFTETH